MDRTVTQELARFAVNLKYQDIPLTVVDKIKTCILHGTCIGLAGMDIIFGKIARAQISKAPTAIGNGAVTLIGDGSKVSVMDAAFASSVLYHGRVQEDTHGTTHIGAITIPLAIALAEMNGQSGKDVITALTAAYEVGGAMGKDYTALTTPRGWRASSIYGIFSAATAAGVLLELNEEEMTHALGLASAFAFGTTESFKQATMEWRFEVGLAARNGYLAAVLAKEGAISAPNALEGDMGYFRAFAGTRENLDKITANLGKVWETNNVTFKLYPVCAFNQTQVINSISLASENDLDPTQISSIEVNMSEYEANYPGQMNWGPFSTHAGTLMSAPFCVAASLLNRKLTLADLHAFEDTSIMDLVNKTKIIPNPEIGFLCSRIVVTLKDGTVIERPMNVTEQYYNLDFARDVEMMNSMKDEIAISDEKLQALIAIVRDLELQDNVDAFVSNTLVD